MGSKKVRVYDLAKELKIDNKKAIEEIRREGVDVSVPSNSVPDDVADRIRAKYYPKKSSAPAVPRLVKTAKAPHPLEGDASGVDVHVAHDYEAAALGAEPTEPEFEEEYDDRPAQPRVRVLKASPSRPAQAE